MWAVSAERWSADLFFSAERFRFPKYSGYSFKDTRWDSSWNEKFLIVIRLFFRYRRDKIALHDLVGLQMRIRLVVCFGSNDDYQQLVFKNENFIPAIPGTVWNFIVFPVHMIGFVPEQIPVIFIFPVGNSDLFRQWFFNPVLRNDLLSLPCTTVLVKLPEFRKIKATLKTKVASDS